MDQQLYRNRVRSLMKSRYNFDFIDDEEFPGLPYETRAVPNEPLMSLSESAIYQSSCDHESQSVSNTIHPNDEFWSCTGSDSPSTAVETLMYRFLHPFCAVRFLQLKLFRAGYQSGNPVYPPHYIQVLLGHSPTCFHYTSPLFKVFATDSIQTWPLTSKAAVGQFMCIRLIGMRQQQYPDLLYYQAVKYVSAVGFPIASSSVHLLSNIAKQNPQRLYSRAVLDAEQKRIIEDRERSSRAAPSSSKPSIIVEEISKLDKKRDAGLSLAAPKSPLSDVSSCSSSSGASSSLCSPFSETPIGANYEKINEKRKEEEVPMMEAEEERAPALLLDREHDEQMNSSDASSSIISRTLEIMSRLMDLTSEGANAFFGRDDGEEEENGEEEEEEEEEYEVAKQTSAYSEEPSPIASSSRLGFKSAGLQMTSSLMRDRNVFVVRRTVEDVEEDELEEKAVRAETKRKRNREGFLFAGPSLSHHAEDDVDYDFFAEEDEEGLEEEEEEEEELDDEEDENNVYDDGGAGSEKEDW